ncbi:hypothetical protein D3C80_1202120 [compost metagenome]
MTCLYGTKKDNPDKYIRSHLFFSSHQLFSIHLGQLNKLLFHILRHNQFIELERFDTLRHFFQNLINGRLSIEDCFRVVAEMLWNDDLYIHIV